MAYVPDRTRRGAAVRMLEPDAWRRHRVLDAAQSVLLLLAMGALLGVPGWVLAGAAGVLAALAGGVALVLLNPGISPRLLLHAYGARELGPRSAPELAALVDALARRAYGLWY